MDPPHVLCSHAVTARSRAALLATVTAALVGSCWPVPARPPPARTPHRPRSRTPESPSPRGNSTSSARKVDAGAQPWKGAFDQMMASRYADPAAPRRPARWSSAVPTPTPITAAPTSARTPSRPTPTRWPGTFTRDERYARKSIELMDAWSADDPGPHQQQRPLQTGWAGSSWPKAAEIIKHTYGGTWANSGRFATMLRAVYLPEVINGSTPTATGS